MAKQCNICGEYADIEKDCPQCGYICGKCSENCDYEVKTVTDPQIEKLREENARFQAELDFRKRELQGIKDGHISPELINSEVASLKYSEEYKALQDGVISLSQQLAAANLELDSVKGALAGARGVRESLERTYYTDLLDGDYLRGAISDAIFKLSTLPTPVTNVNQETKAPDLKRIAACVKAARLWKEEVSQTMPTVDEWLKEQGIEPKELTSETDTLLVSIQALTPEDHAWVERVGGA